MEQRKIKTIASLYDLEGLYYSLDGHNIFKRADRYELRPRFIFLFGISVLINLFEIIFSILLLTNIIDPKEENYASYERLIISVVPLINIGATLCFSSFTTTKLKIQSFVFY